MSEPFLETIEQLIDRLEFRSIPRKSYAGPDPYPDSDSEGVDPQTWDSVFEGLAQEAIKTYLRGPGHPQHAFVCEMLGEEAILQGSRDPHLRARLFLRSICGAEVLPEDGSSLKIFISHTGTIGPAGLNTGENLPLPTPIEFISCFYQCTLTINDGVRNLLQAGPPYSVFEAWFHGAVLEPSEYQDIY
ncbi:hypothetical protein K466DRAFT_601968 [Polyporus arcularius HHB13444]|uniref:Uncharacterized protein n=1 Tax=Polyporus arcularius HHB13444 TaxID=1314778 RepID=A0A5C3P492_9APHY|nr:hypothetical protein K466DRAFT_601968 [Polyporus arcularius HHB13444]